MKIDFTQIAIVCHEANRAYCETIGDYSQKPWDKAEAWQRESALSGVTFAFDHPNADPSAQHVAWMNQKERDGWVLGPVKDAEKKQHPCMVPYYELPIEQRIKDHIFRAIVHAFIDAEKSE